MSDKKIVRITHDYEVIRAYQNAIEKFDEFKNKFINNADDSVLFIVKIGFSVSRKDKGPIIPITTIEDHIFEDARNDVEPVTIEPKEVDTEWMWVTVKEWNDSKISGTINNEPLFRKDLKFGTRIEFSERAVMDWIIAKDDKILEGNFLEQVLKGKGKPVNL